MRIRSSAFQDGEPIPDRHARGGGDVSPPLVIEEVPAEAESLALIVDDPDAPAGTWVHWLVWGIPADRTALPEDVPPDGEVALLGGARQGTNDFGGIGWGGPQPPRGHGVHHYRFTVHALSGPIDLEPGATREALDAALADRSLATARLTGTFERR